MQFIASYAANRSLVSSYEFANCVRNELLPMTDWSLVIVITLTCVAELAYQRLSGRLCFT